MSNVLNFFDQATGAANDDNILHLTGTVVGRNGTQAANVPDASDLGTAITLANALKDIVIDLGMMAPDP